MSTNINGRRLVYLLVAVLVVAGVWYLYPKDSDETYGDITAQEAKELIDKKPDLVILDVRTVGEYTEEHIEGAINIPVGELEDRLEELDKTWELLVYCRTGNRSSSAVKILEDNGYTKIFHMTGGIVKWKEAGYPTVQ
jgi:rhodanese-related sulfurtransferase